MKQFKLNREDDQKETLEVNEDTTTVDVNEHDSGNEWCHSERQKWAPVRYGFMQTLQKLSIWHAMCEISEPWTFEEAMTGDRVQEWKAAADSE